LKLVVPYIGKPKDLDARIVKLAEFLGISCASVALASAIDHAEFLRKSVPDECSCFAANPEVLKEWLGSHISAELVAFLLSRFTHIIVYGLRGEAFDAELISALSKGRLRSVEAIDEEHSVYTIAEDSKDVCEAFAGLSFGPVNPGNDRVLSLSNDEHSVRSLISIAGRPMMASLKSDRCTIWLLAGADIVDIDAEAADAPLSEYFSRSLPHAMALRAIFGEESWRPGEQHASVIIDDPLLRSNYGFLNFESLLGLMKEHNFSTTIAFIPYNYRRSATKIARLFRDNGNRFSLCFHGNDHMDAEFASDDTATLNTMLQIAERRMNLHKQMTGVGCDRVMVFPQGKFSVPAMAVLKSQNFLAAVNTVTKPKNSNARLTFAEIAQPAVLRYGNFPLFLRKNCLRTQNEDIAFNCFFGRPVLIVEHHDILRDPQTLADAATRINKVASAIRWSNLATAVSRSTLSRRTPDGIHHIRAYSGTVRVHNDSAAVKRCSVEWSWSDKQESLDGHVLEDGMPSTNYIADGSGTQVLVELPPDSSRTVSVTHRNPYGSLKSTGIRQNARAFLRRRLSEVRDNYLSKSPRVLAAAKTLQQRLTH
jgi:hypothetical protein